MHTEMKCESGKTEGLRSKRKGGCILGECPSCVECKGPLAVVGKSRKQNTFLCLKAKERDPAPCQPGEKSQAAVAERGEKVAEQGVRCSVPGINTQLVSGLCLCWEGEMCFLSACFLQGFNCSF